MNYDVRFTTAIQDHICNLLLCKIIRTNLLPVYAVKLHYAALIIVIMICCIGDIGRVIAIYG